MWRVAGEARRRIVCDGRGSPVFDPSRVVGVDDFSGGEKMCLQKGGGTDKVSVPRNHTHSIIHLNTHISKTSQQVI